jgi:apolipoprotein N-acyltransferase
MNISDPVVASTDTTSPAISATRTAMLFAISGAIGGAGWSGRPSLHYFALLFPVVYLQSRRRLDSLSAIFYYAAATWVVVPGSEGFFPSGRNPLLPILIWVALTGLGAAPWIFFYNRRWLPVSAIAAVIVLALPPLSLVTVAHPLIAAGQWFPGTRWFGLCLPLVLIAAYRQLGHLARIAILIGAFIVTHVRFARPSPDPRIVVVNSEFDITPEQHLSGSTLEIQEASLQRTALAHPNALVILPESIIPNWSPSHEARWAHTFALLKEQHTGLLIGTTIPISNTEANRNILLSRGFTERLSYVQRVPVPLGMWQFGSEHNGFPLMLRFPPTIRIWNRRAGVLICYEQLIVWPALQTLAHNPELLIAPSNVYWASNTTIPAIQHITAQDWADLWSIPLYEASNR